MTAAAVAHPFETSNTVTNARIAALPKAARDKLEHLRRVEQRSRAMADGLHDEMNRVRGMRDDAEVRLGFHDRNYAGKYVVEENEATGARKRLPAGAPERAAIVAEV